MQSYERELRELRELAEIYRRYEEFLNDANDAPITLAALHGWKCPQEDIDRGKEFRRQIAELRVTTGLLVGNG